MNRMLSLIVVLLALITFNAHAGPDKSGVSGVGGGGGYLEQAIIDLRAAGNVDCEIYHLLGGGSTLADHPDLVSALEITPECLL